MDDSQRIDLIYTGDPVLTIVFIGLLFILLIMLFDEAFKK